MPTGIGPVAAGAAAEAVLERNSPANALAVGLCGAASPSLDAGDALIYGSIQHLGDDPIVLDGALAARVASRLPDAFTGIRGLSVDNVVSSAARKRELFETGGIDALDMESFALVRRLRAAGVRVAVLRTVSDGPHHDLPDLSGAIDNDGKLAGTALAVAMLSRPGAAWRMSLGSLRALRAIERCVARLFG